MKSGKHGRHTKRNKSKGCKHCTFTAAENQSLKQRRTMYFCNAQLCNTSTYNIGCKLVILFVIFTKKYLVH